MSVNKTGCPLNNLCSWNEFTPNLILLQVSGLFLPPIWHFVVTFHNCKCCYLTLVPWSSGRQVLRLIQGVVIFSFFYIDSHIFLTNFVFLVSSFISGGEGEMIKLNLSDCPSRWHPLASILILKLKPFKNQGDKFCWRDQLVFILPFPLMLKLSMLSICKIT